ncbi:hypothetical protein FRC04_005755 [Tulasnella sp. 424]|nr:hypothetical protein FRC04_005755 [Tulasnella sp. 424]
MYNIFKKATRFIKRVLKLQGSAQLDLPNTAQYAPLIGTWLRRHSCTINLQTGHANVFIIICLCYGGLEWPEGGSMELEGPKNDLLLLLRNLRYRHRNEDRQFLIFTDFEVSFQDHTGFSDTVATIRATHDNLASRVPDTMRDLDREDKCAIYFSGHIDSPQAGQGSARIILRDDDGIYDHELRGWLNQSRFPTTTIVAILDACHSGGFLGLPYVHTKGDRSISTTNGTYGEQMNSQVVSVAIPLWRFVPNPIDALPKVEISSTSRDQLSFGDKYKGDGESETTHGILTWHLLEYLKGGQASVWRFEVQAPLAKHVTFIVNPRPNLHDLAAHIYSKCATSWIDERGGQKHEWHQVPVFSSSRRISGRVSLL